MEIDKLYTNLYDDGLTLGGVMVSHVLLVFGIFVPKLVHRENISWRVWSQATLLLSIYGDNNCLNIIEPKFILKIK